MTLAQGTPKFNFHLLQFQIMKGGFAQGTLGCAGVLSSYRSEGARDDTRPGRPPGFEHTRS
ncbi:hypothetical protein Mapa_015624 [Marchantia paleacea]|nr:hypothetical protein Mapa_015624 [Marchantia paleacea]